jgi:hypothetical protein
MWPLDENTNSGPPIQQHVLASRAVPGSGLNADGVTGRARLVVDDDHGYLLGVARAAACRSAAAARPAQQSEL